MLEDVLRENEAQKQEIERLREQVTSLERKKESLLAENRLLRDRLDKLIRRVLHHRSEKFHPGQLSLPLFEELAKEAAEAVQDEIAERADDLDNDPPDPKPRRRHGRKRLPPNLPHVREEVNPDPGELVCKICHGQMSCIGSEITEKLDYEPARYFVRDLVRNKYACTHCQEGVVTASLPPDIIEKGRPGAGMLAHVAVSKYADHLPLYRQEQIFARGGLDLRRTTLCDWMGHLSARAEPIVLAMKQEILSAPVIQSDDTHVQVRDAETKGKTRRGFLWVYGPPWAEVVYDFSLGRGREVPQAFLNGYQGYLQTDAYGGYNDVFRTGKVVHIGCFAHVRRRFFEARTHAPEETTVILALIQTLYRIEREAKEQGLTGAALLQLRTERALPVLHDLRGLLERLRPTVLPHSRLGEAITYALGQWDALERYVGVAEAQIDNNGAENAMRAPVLGRKNWLFLGDAEGGGLRATVLYSLVVSCKRLKIDPFAYLKDIIERLPTQPLSRMAELTPRRWKEARVGQGQPP